MLKIGIIGCGKIADAHVEEVRHTGLAEVCAVCDLEPLLAEQLAVRYGVPHRYADAAQMLRSEDLDVVHICTPPHSHLALAQQAVAAGCDVFVEKPITLDYATARELVELVEQAGRKLAVGYTMYFSPTAMRMRDAISRGLIGTPVHVESFYGYALGGTFGSSVVRDKRHWVRSLPGQLFHNVLDHMLNKVTEFVTDDHPTVTVVAAARGFNAYGDDHLVDEVRITLRGTSCTAYLTFSGNVRPTAHFLRVYGTEAAMTVDFVGETIFVERPPVMPGALGRLALPLAHARRYLSEARLNIRRFRRSEYRFFAGLTYLLTEFYSSIQNDTPPPIPYGEYLRVAELTDEIVRQVYPPKVAAV